MTKKWVYGRDPNPRSWHETADILKQQNKPVKKPASTAHLEAIEKLLKESKS